jgi:hypothetical protein
MQKHVPPGILMQGIKLHKFIIITIIVPLEHDSVVRRENALGDPLLDDLRTLVEFAQAGSIAGAADRLFGTPSAITCQVQRLEAALGAELLDRSVKPPRLNSLGSRMLEQARDLLQRTEALKSLPGEYAGNRTRQHLSDRHEHHRPRLDLVGKLPGIGVTLVPAVFAIPYCGGTR